MFPGAGHMGQWLRAWTILPKDIRSNSQHPHGSSQLSPAAGDLTLIHADWNINAYKSFKNCFQLLIFHQMGVLLAFMSVYHVHKVPKKEAEEDLGSPGTVFRWLQSTIWMLGTELGYAAKNSCAQSLSLLPAKDFSIWPPLISAPGRQREAGGSLEVQGQFVLQIVFQNNQSYTNLASKINKMEKIQ